MWIFIVKLILIFVSLAHGEDDIDEMDIRNFTDPETTFNTAKPTYYYSSYFSSTSAETEIPPCGSFVLKDPSGSFNSPRYPGFYPRDQDCKWTIEVAKGMIIKLTISEINIEWQSSCKFDVLKVFDGPDVNSSFLTQICHRGFNSTVVTSSGNQMTVTFTSDETIGGKFKAAYKAVTTCKILKILWQGRHLKWFKFTDNPTAPNLIKALAKGKAKEMYMGLSKKPVTFNVQGKGKFKVEISLQTRYVSSITFTFFTKKKGKKAGVKNVIAITDTKSWTTTTISHPKKIVRFSISMTWDATNQGKGTDKINVKDFAAKACLDK